MPLKSRPPWNVLVFPAASEVGLEIHRALRNLKEAVLYGVNQPGPSVAAHHFARLDELPPISDKDCLPRLQDLIARHKIDAIFPANDDVVLWLAQNAAQLTAAVITSPLAACEICRSKSRTYEAVKDLVPVPARFKPDDAGISFPVFVKPDRGSGSRRARLVASRSELEQAFRAEPDLIVMENLPGREFTVDCFSQNGEVLFAQARERLQMKTGIAVVSQFADLPEAQQWAERLGKKLSLRGGWFFQMKEDKYGKLKLLEIAPRIAGSMSLSHAIGPNFPLLSLYETAGVPVNVDRFAADFRLGRSLDTRLIYDRPIGALYMDLDDALIIRGQVNTGLAALIFQCRNRKIPVHLITRHKSNLGETLKRYGLTALFDRIVHIEDDVIPKAKYIVEADAVLVDDSFAERHAAAKSGHIRCFDPSAALCLLDDRD